MYIHFCNNWLFVCINVLISVTQTSIYKTVVPTYSDIYLHVTFNSISNVNISTKQKA